MAEEYLSFNEASQYLNISEKCLRNYSKVGGEFKTVREGRRIVTAKSKLEAWKSKRDSRLFNLNRTDYLVCLNFAVKSFYNYSSTSDFGTTTQREAGKFVSNFVSGKLGEIGVKYFLKSRFDTDIKLDFDIHDAVTGQDITEVSKPRKGPKVFNPPKVRVSIKTTKMKNVWLIVGENELNDPARTSDIYILTRVDLYPDHLLRLLKEHPLLSKMGKIIPKFEKIPCEIVGFCLKRDLLSQSPVRVLPDPKQDIQPSYIMRSGELRRSDAQWMSNLINRL